MNRHKDESAGGPTSDGNKKRRRNDDASGASGGRGSGHGGRGNNRRRHGHGRGRGRGGRGHASGGRGDSTGDGGRHNRNSTAHGRGSGRHTHGRNSHNGNGGRRMPNHHHNRHSNNDNGHVSNPSTKSQPNINRFSTLRTERTHRVSANSSEVSSLANDSDSIIIEPTTTNLQKNDASKTITILSWPNPHSHYIPIEEEERLLPVLIHWGRKERGMMKDQPPFRLPKIEKMLEKDRDAPKQGKGKGEKSNNSQEGNSKRKANNPPSNSSYPRTQQISLIQSLSLRRHHMKLLNPRFSMSSLRLGDTDDIRNAAELFEVCVDEYLRSEGVQYWTEEDQRSKFDKSMKGVPFHQRKQPPTPDFMMKDGHCVMLSLTSEEDSSKKDADNDTHPTSINWIEAKMFYGANTIASGTPNAVGCILPKMKDYVSLYGTGAIVFMYGCGSQLAAQLLEVGVVALDGRGLALDRVEKQQKRWCADSWGSILF